MFDRKQTVLQSSNGDHDVAAVLTREAMHVRTLHLSRNVGVQNLNGTGEVSD
jgi:hypothetical protein